jgi:nucleoside-diphosphate-sugar epimerase
MQTTGMSRSIVVAVTGADGFIGRNLCECLRNDGFIVRPIYGPRWRGNCAENECCLTIDFRRELPSPQVLEGCDALIHLAAIAHRLKGIEKGVIEKINGEVPSSLARWAHQAGVRRFVFMSSVAVIPLIENGLISGSGTPPHKDSYGSAKLFAESKLRTVANETGIEVVIVRPPAVYGPGAPGRLAQLMRLIHLGVPFPCAHNKRSLVGIENLVNLLATCSHHPKASGMIFSVSDCALSSNEIIRFLAQGMGRAPVFLPVPIAAIRLCLQLFGRSREGSHYLDSFVVDSEDASRLLGWFPAKPAPDGLSETGAYFIQNLCPGIAIPTPR